MQLMHDPNIHDAGAANAGAAQMHAPQRSFAQIVATPDAQIDLSEAALVIAGEEYQDLDVAAYQARLDEMAGVLKRRLRPDLSAAGVISALNRFLFEEHGFSGNEADYYDPRNSFLNEVLDRKLGIPITLAVLYMEIGRRVGLQVQGVSFPAHFLVKCVLHEGTVVLDPYAKGISLGVDDLRRRLQRLPDGKEAQPAGMLAAATNKGILLRMLRNLKAVYAQRKEWMKALRTAGHIIELAPAAADEYRDRAMIYLNLECARAALDDFQSYLKFAPHAKDARSVRATISQLGTIASRLN